MNFGIIDRILLLGGGDLLRQLVLESAAWNEDVFVITSPRQASEIGLNSPQTLKAFLRQQKVPHFITNTVNVEVTKALTERTLGLSISATWIFKQDFIDRFNGKLVNIHGTPLPRNRGGGGTSWAIMQGMREGGATIHLVDSGIDTGKIVLAKAYRYPASCTIPREYEEYASKQRVALLKEFLQRVRAQRRFAPRTQEENASTYWPRLATDVHGYINWSWSAIDIQNFIRAFDEPFRGASTFIGECKLRLKDCRVFPSKERFHPFQWGLVYRIEQGAYFIACDKGTIVVRNVRDEGGKPLSIRLGDRFHTPTQFLDDALRYRAVYTPTGLK